MNSKAIGLICIGVFPGLALTGVLGFISIVLAQSVWLQTHGISALTLAIILGLLVGNTGYTMFAARVESGVIYAKSNLLRIAIILYGFRLTFQDIAIVGWAGVAIDAAVLCSTFALAYSLGTRVFGLDRQTSILIGAGSSICGAAAVIATESVVRTQNEKVIVAVTTVVVFGTLAIFIYPALYHLNEQFNWVNLTPSAYGLYVGSTVHEVAQVVAAGRAIGEQAANTAVITKMVRVMMLAPFLLALSVWLSRSLARPDAQGSINISSRCKYFSGLVMPWFALGFIAVTAINSLSILPSAVVSAMVDLDTALLAMAMVALGLTTQISVIRSAGIKPLGLAVVLFAWLICGGFALNTGILMLGSALT